MIGGYVDCSHSITITQAYALKTRMQKPPAETMGWLRYKFFGRRADVWVVCCETRSRVFSKNFQGDYPMVGRC
jgi:hypothetical protein